MWDLLYYIVYCVNCVILRSYIFCYVLYFLLCNLCNSAMLFWCVYHNILLFCKFCYYVNGVDWFFSLSFFCLKFSDILKFIKLLLFLYNYFVFCQFILFCVLLVIIYIFIYFFYKKYTFCKNSLDFLIFFIIITTDNK